MSITSYLAIILSGCFLIVGVARSDETGQTSSQQDGGSGTANTANDPTTPKLQLQYWNYYSPVLNGANGTAENGIGRLLLPFKVGDVQNVFHVTPPVTSSPSAATGPRTGLGNLQIYNFSDFKVDLGLPEKVTIGFGPLVAPPTISNKNFGTNRWQAGGAGAFVAPQKWGLVGVLATYQHTLSGPSSAIITVQTHISYNLSNDFYFRSSGISTFNTRSHTSYIPIGLGMGKIFDIGGYTLNVYAEAQPSIYRSGRDAPALQVFTGVALQWPSSVTSGLKF